MIRKAALLLCLCIAPVAVKASCPGTECTAQEASKPTQSDKEKWFKEAREMKHQFLAKELQLTKEQQKPFFDLYDRMEDESVKVQRETRQMERNVNKLGADATDLDYERASDALFDVKQKEASIELRFKEEFKKILTPRQLFLLKGAERKFTKELMNRHQKLRNAQGHGQQQPKKK